MLVIYKDSQNIYYLLFSTRDIYLPKIEVSCERHRDVYHNWIVSILILSRTSTGAYVSQTPSVFRPQYELAFRPLSPSYSKYPSCVLRPRVEIVVVVEIKMTKSATGRQMA